MSRRTPFGILFDTNKQHRCPQAVLLIERILLSGPWDVWSEEERIKKAIDISTGGCPSCNDHYRGRLAEVRVLKAMSAIEEPLPPWILLVRQATREEDSLGGDIVVVTIDAGKFLVQVKASASGLHKRSRGYYRDRGIEAIVFPPRIKANTKGKIRQQILDFAGKARIERLRQKEDVPKPPL